MQLKSLYEGTKENAAIALIRSIISGSKFENNVYIAGGFVRDEILGGQPKDIDVVVDLPNGGIEFAEFITKELNIYKQGSNPVVFERFGTAKFILNGVEHLGEDLSDIEIEAVAPRQEKYRKQSRKPDVSVGSLKQDIERRDFTINTLLKNLSTNEIEDLTGIGRQDIEAGIIRTPLDPDIIFSEDPLRMLRAIRFAVKYGWQFAPGLEKAIKRNANRLTIISKERIRDELQKMLISTDPKRAINLLMDTGLIEYVNLKLAEAMRLMVGMKQNKHHHLDVYNHVLEAIANSQSGVANRLAALLHDIAKPQTRAVKPPKGFVGKLQHLLGSKEYSFLGHEGESADLAKEIMYDLKFPKAIIDEVITAIAGHMRMKDPHTAKNKAVRRWIRAMSDHIDTAIDLLYADAMAHKGTDPNDPGGVKYLKRRIQELKVEPTVISGQKIITGHDIKDAFKLEPGPIFKQILDFAQNIVDENPGISKENLLDKIAIQFDMNWRP